MQDRGGHLTLGRGENITHFVIKKKGKQLMLGDEGVTHLVKKRLGVLNRSIFQEPPDPSSSASVQLIVSPKGGIEPKRSPIGPTGSGF